MSNSLRLCVVLVVSCASATILNFNFPFNNTQVVPFNISVDRKFVHETVLKASWYRPSVDLCDAPQNTIEGPLHKYMANLADTWANHYDWDKEESEMNANLSHYAITLPGEPGYSHPVPLHFVHERSKVADAIPILLIHGWPSSHYEWHKVIPQLLSPQSSTQSFHIVAPDLPGFGFSPAPTYSGLGPKEIGVVLDKLMQRLGYERYGVVSTDVGWNVGMMMAETVGKNILGHFTDFFIVTPSPSDLERLARNQTTQEEARYIQGSQAFFDHYSVHATVQSTSPLALGQALSDTPVGFAGWIWNLMRQISDGYPYTSKEVITSAFLLWIQGTYGHMRLYREIFSRPDPFKFGLTKVPTGVTLWGNSNGPFKEIAYFSVVPRAWIERAVNLVFFAEHTGGGHFPALNEPEAWVKDVHAFFSGIKTEF